MRVPIRSFVVLAGLVLLLASGLGWAAEEETSGRSASADFLGKVVNFVILFGALGYILRKPLKKFLDDRVAKTRSNLKTAEDDALEARSKLKSIEERALALGPEIEALRERAEADGLAEKARILKAAEAEAARLKGFSEQEIEALVRAGIRELKEYAGDKAISLALERVRDRLTPESQSRLVDASIDKLAQAYEEKHPDPALRPRTH